MRKICIIIPCYNEAERLSIKEFTDFINNSENVYFCFVNDGSRDKTFEVLQSMKNGTKERILIVNLEKNKGKAEAVRKGILESLKWLNFDMLGYFDADLSTPLSEIYTLLSSIDKKESYQFAFGSRVKFINNTIERNFYRHYFGRVFATFASIILRLSIYDTQCGAKLIKKDITTEIFIKPFYSKWFFGAQRKREWGQ